MLSRPTEEQLLSQAWEEDSLQYYWLAMAAGCLLIFSTLAYLGYSSCIYLVIT